VPGRFRRLVLAATLCALLTPAAGASAEPKYHECQKPVVTGVEIWGLRNITPARACPPALALYSWENSNAKHARVLYGCRRPSPQAGGRPYLRLHSFHGWKLSLVGREQEFTMSRQRSSFHVGGTDFPLDCS